MSKPKQKKFYPKFKRFVFTGWNVEQELNYDSEYIHYLVYQLERCPDTGRLHYQGYCELEKEGGQRLKWIKTYFKDEKMHIESAHGTGDQCTAYCTKLESRVDGPWTHGEMRQQGRRRDLDSLFSDIRGGAKMKDIAESNPQLFVQYGRGLESYRKIAQPAPRRDDIKLYYFWGDPRTGKSRKAHEMFPDAFKMNDNTNGWMDGYDGEDAVIIDDFEGLIPRGQLLKMCDRYPLSVPVKGSMVNFRGTKIVFTSNYAPDSFGGYGSAFTERLREFGEVVEFRRKEA